MTATLQRMGPLPRYSHDIAHNWGSPLLTPSGDQGPYVACESPHTAWRTPEMFDLSDHSDYARWLNAFTEASARLDALESAVAHVRHLLRCSGHGDD